MGVSPANKTPACTTQDSTTGAKSAAKKRKQVDENELELGTPNASKKKKIPVPAKTKTLASSISTNRNSGRGDAVKTNNGDNSTAGNADIEARFAAMEGQ